ncbi:MAG: TlpA family protein disulfide reductase [bacterium]|nr:TlpA family protein disulfide reductase [bacterium]
MSTDKKHIDEDKGYCTPSITADLLATLIGLALVYGMIALVGNGSGGDQAKAAPQAMNFDLLKSKARGKLAAFFVYKKPKPVPEFTYVDEAGTDHSLKELRGKVVLLNLWATWCGPCRHEMPWLDALKNKYQDQPFEMLTISIDRGGLKKPRRFFNKINVKHLTLYIDKTGRLAPKLRAFGMPTTLLIGPHGQELGRIAGPAEWASEDAFAFIEAAIASTKTTRNQEEEKRL